jgi:hypothetical protein
MLTKTKIILAVAVIFGAASAAQASDHENQSGGFRIGPLGQKFAPRSPSRKWLHEQRMMAPYGSAYAPAYGYGPADGYAYAPGRSRTWNYQRGW